MIIYPAIDLRGGKVVRLREGDPNRQTIFSDDPVATARQWIAEGALWIHMVNLDGAFAQANNNGAILEAVAALNVKVQFAGGLRSPDDIARALQRGASAGSYWAQSPFSSRRSSRRRSNSGARSRPGWRWTRATAR
ncbi:MAG: HisA/HisF-related TIM barrel protein [Anaerolineae bacterium]